MEGETETESQRERKRVRELERQKGEIKAFTKTRTLGGRDAQKERETPRPREV